MIRVRAQSQAVISNLHLQMSHNLFQNATAISFPSKFIFYLQNENTSFKQAPPLPAKSEQLKTLNYIKKESIQSIYGASADIFFYQFF